MNLSKKEAYELCSEMWNLIAEHGYDDKKYALCPEGPYTEILFSCFACEYHGEDCCNCPFDQFDRGCLTPSSPYTKWYNSRYNEGSGARQWAIEIAQLFIDNSEDNLDY